MAFCASCGKEMKDGTKFCPSCGASADGKAAVSVTSGKAPQPAPNDGPSAGLAVLSFFFTWLGAILFLVWKNRSPEKAKSCAQGLAIAIIIGTIFMLLSMISMAALYPMLMSSAGNWF